MCFGSLLLLIPCVTFYVLVLFFDWWGCAWFGLLFDLKFGT